MFSFHDASEALKLPLRLPHPQCPAQGASIDSRKINEGELFVAIKGKQTDGHAYLEQVFQQKAAGALISRVYFNEHQTEIKNKNGVFKNLILSDFPETDFMRIAAWYRGKFSIPVIGVTGSVGKTTTKDFLYFLMSQKQPGVGTQKNLNNHLGVPLTLMRLTEESEFAVCELGASMPYEIRRLAEIARPTAGIITAVSAAHLEGFGSLEKIYETKLGLFEALPSGAPALIPDNDPELLRRAAAFDVRLLKVGQSPGSDYRLDNVRAEDKKIHFRLNGKYEFCFPGSAPFLAFNAAMAAAAAHEAGFDLKDQPQSWEGISWSGGRFEEKFFPGNIRLIDDSYNASPLSFQKAIESFAAMPAAGRKIAVISDMLELGSQTKKFHENLGMQLSAQNFDLVIGYGSAVDDCFSQFSKPSPSHAWFKLSESEAVIEYLKNYLMPGDSVLLKGSRSMGVDKVALEIGKNCTRKFASSSDSQSASVK